MRLLERANTGNVIDHGAVFRTFSIGVFGCDKWSTDLPISLKKKIPERISPCGGNRISTCVSTVTLFLSLYNKRVSQMQKSIRHSPSFLFSAKGCKFLTEKLPKTQIPGIKKSRSSAFYDEWAEPKAQPICRCYLDGNEST